MSAKNKDSLGWMVQKQKVDEKPKVAKGGETYVFLYKAYEEVKSVVHWRDPVSGRESDFPVVNTRLAVRLPNGAVGFVDVRDDDYSEIAQKFDAAGFPESLPYTIRDRSRRK